MVKKKAAAKKTASKKTTTKKVVTKKSTAKKAVAKKAVTKKKAASGKKASVVTYITNEERYRMVQEAAYHLSEKQAFAPGRDIDNWLLAEIDIEALMKKKNIQVK